MSFGTSIARWLKTLNSADMHFTQLAQASNTNIVVPASGAFWPGKPRAGYIRIKQATLNQNANVKIGAIQATDGTNIANLYAGDASSSQNNQYIDSSFLFVYDWEVTNFSVNCVTTNNTATFDVEVVGVR
jgi:hypothetical protein